MTVKNFKLKVPATSANLGPGFDTLGVALSLYLTIEGSYDPTGADAVSFECSGEGAELMPHDVEKNLITNSALFVLKNNQIDRISGTLKLKIHNEIPLGRGLGSSGAAVVGGVLLGNIVGDLNLSQNRVIDFIQHLEGHPDNVVPAYLGGLIASYVVQSKGSEEAGNFPAKNIVRFSALKWSKNIKVVAVVPRYELATSKARGVLPQNYSRQDVVFNLQRLAVLTSSLTEETPNPELIYGAMDDCIHQPYRLELVPGLKQVLNLINPVNEPGTLGICLSGAGPTVLILSNERQEAIGKRCQDILKEEGGVDSDMITLSVDFEGAQITIN